jgi:glycosyltransferase involved in cell wall biosynthesis
VDAADAGRSVVISALVQTRNEAARLSFALSTLRWCDEIVVVDMESTDDTPAIAREFTDRVYSVTYAGIPEPAREFAVARCRGEWVFILDADEMVPTELARRLRSEVAADRTDVVWVARQNFLLGAWLRHGAWWPDRQPRFFRKGAIRFLPLIHTKNEVLPGRRQLRLPARPGLALVHLKERTLAEYAAKEERYTAIEARQRREAGEAFSWRALLWATARELAGRLVYKGGFRDGARGVLLAGAAAFYRALAWAKLWELERNPDPEAFVTRERERLLAEWASEGERGRDGLTGGGRRGSLGAN